VEITTAITKLISRFWPTAIALVSWTVPGAYGIVRKSVVKINSAV
jgi:hypothetical protein